MASIRMSEQLRSDIKRKAAAIFQPAIDKANVSLAPDFYRRLYDDAYDKIITQHPVLQKLPIDQWPKDWVQEIKGFDGHIYDGTTLYYISRDLDLKYKVPASCNLVSYNSRLKIGNFSCGPALFDEYDQWQKKCGKQSKKKSDFVEQISNILKRCNTLKQFLNAWPQGENLVPADVMAKYNAPPEKRINPAEHITPDVSTELSSTLVKQTIINHGHNK